MSLLKVYCHDDVLEANPYGGHVYAVGPIRDRSTAYLYEVLRYDLADGTLYLSCGNVGYRHLTNFPDEFDNEEFSNV